ncbi:MAG TPA: trehalase family glycosidase [Armatimonadota bacterium]|jgi:hypothetical protein
MTELPGAVPQSDYVPFGYLDNPWHSAVANRSGIIRSVPPMGFGFWCRSMPWPYGMGARREINYLSFLHPAVIIDGVPFHQAEDFEREGVELVSRYHTQNLMSYDWSFRGVSVRLLYHLNGEHTLCCHVELKNESGEARQVSVHATHIYGYPELRWWGSDGVASRYNVESGAAVAKIWASGDVFALSGGPEFTAYKATASAGEWRAWMAGNDLSSNEGASSTSPEPVYSVLSASLKLEPGSDWFGLVTLTRSTNEVWAVKGSEEARSAAEETLKRLLAEDGAFYASAPVLAGDWPADWKHGWIYDLETLRMNVREPVGIFTHHWDAMQVFTPRSVLGEAVIDATCLSYSDAALAKDVILGTFADAPMPNVPCVREDGSMNMISMGGEECGTAPIWVLPFRSIRAVFDRDGDAAWVTALYPHLEAFVQWWLDNRTDATGRFFCNNSWESGQDGSKRFLLEEGEEGKEAEFVQTVDVEAAMADAMATLAYLAPVAGRPERAAHWTTMAQQRADATRAMYVDGWFRDFDARTGTPIMLPDYVDVMMLFPLAVGIATPEQMKAIRPMFDYFLANPKHWLEWPSFMFVFTEAGWNAGLRQMMSDVVAKTADRVYGRTNSSKTVEIDPARSRIPEPYNYRIPGIANEFWPMEPATLAQSSAEAYGWGATLPTLVLRNIIGFREDGSGFTLAPTLPGSLLTPGRLYTVTNLRYRECRFDLTLETLQEGRLKVGIRLHGASAGLAVTGSSGPVEAAGAFEIVNGDTLSCRIIQ